ncbi:D-alanyl-D-alanine endopeptidase precursor [Oligella ureolytica]|uniref:D-alanyl-D-alanine endopeptidase n=1 Tax=Oligella ureolytica TaxID=90244 RepID=A0A378XIH1_9BURK|nr:serine hydrolase [Oligella ureolytica]NLP33173.1 peptidase S11 [Oligella ureolytica]QPT39965.1 serine hydrolase [Oligella ureolytica]SUA58150.1 D-alanyl-D-alanine endopeptidase precursor [Oligella ureolytica]
MLTLHKSSFKQLGAVMLALCCGFASSAAHAQHATGINTAPIIGQVDNGGAILSSEIALVVSLDDNQVVYSKNADVIRPIASISKLLSALVITRSGLPLDEKITISSDDIDRVKKSSSRLSVGTTLTRREMLLLSLMSSENRAAHALGRTYPGGMTAFVNEMNATARQLGMTRSRFVEPTGLSPMNVSTPRDLVRLLQAVEKDSTIKRFSTSDDYSVITSNGRTEKYRNTNRLIRNQDWDISISKTGYIRESGQNLVMYTEIDKRPMAVVLLNADNRLNRFADAVRIRHLVQNDYPSLF